jgi:hypothetical protein
LFWPPEGRIAPAGPEAGVGVSDGRAVGGAAAPSEPALVGSARVKAGIGINVVVRVLVGVLVKVGVRVMVGVTVEVGMGVGERKRRVAVRVGVMVGRRVGVRVSVIVGVGVKVGTNQFFRIMGRRSITPVGSAWAIAPAKLPAREDMRRRAATRIKRRDRNMARMVRKRQIQGYLTMSRRN